MYAEAMRLASEGRVVEARAMLEDRARALGAGERGSPAHADALQDLALLLAAVGQRDAAVPPLREACGYVPPPGDEAARRNHLTMLMNLGELLQAAGEPGEAEPVLRQGLAGRAEFYGTDHPGYAFGLEPLGMLLLEGARFEEAGPVLDRTVEIFWRAGHERIATVLALQGEALAAAAEASADGRRRRGLLEVFPQLPEALARSCAAQVIGRASARPRASSRALLDQLERRALERFGESDPMTASVRAAQANLESDLGEAGDDRRRVAAARGTARSHGLGGRVQAEVQALQGLALALSAAGEPEQSLALYEELAARADLEPAVRSQVLRNAALYLDDLGRSEEAAERFRRGLELTAASGAMEAEGHLQAAYGIRLAHQGRCEEARPHLQRARTLLARVDPDALCAHAHLLGCEAGSHDIDLTMPAAVEEACRLQLEEVLASYPVERVEVTLTAGDLKVGLHGTRALSDEEGAGMSRLVDQTLADFRAAIAASRR